MSFHISAADHRTFQGTVPYSHPLQTGSPHFCPVLPVRHTVSIMQKASLTQTSRAGSSAQQNVLWRKSSFRKYLIQLNVTESHVWARLRSLEGVSALITKSELFLTSNWLFSQEGAPKVFWDAFSLNNTILICLVNASLCRRHCLYCPEFVGFSKYSKFVS